MIDARQELAGEFGDPGIRRYSGRGRGRKEGPQGPPGQGRTAAETAQAPRRSPSACNSTRSATTARRTCPAVLKAVAKMGYQGVEFAGYYGRKAEELRKLLDDNGLKCCGTHTGLNTLTGDALEGHRRVQQDDRQQVPDRSRPAAAERGLERRRPRRPAKLFTELAAKVKAEGMRVGYHAHGGDFKKIDGETRLGHPLQQRRPGRGHADRHRQLPWAAAATRSPCSRSSPAARSTIHLKEHGGKPGAVVGEGDVEVERGLPALRDHRRHRVVHRRAGSLRQRHAAGGVKKCIENLKKMGKV